MEEVWKKSMKVEKMTRFHIQHLKQARNGASDELEPLCILDQKIIHFWIKQKNKDE